MIRCPRCQHENPPPSKFCLGCGTSLAVRCGACGADLPPDARFCNQCGQPSTAVSPAPPRFGSPGAYTPRHLAEKILVSKSALEGERKQVTVLFADLKGSMELLADRDPEDARRLLDPVLERMMEAVHRYEGTVNQVMGDGIMALFGAPLAHEDHAVRACYAALRMQEAIARYGDQIQRSGMIPVQIRVGLNSGVVVVRSIGSDLHMDYTAVGQTTHLAARLEQLARPGTTLMTGNTLRLAEGYVKVKPLGPVPVKGLGEPVEVYEVTGPGPARTRLQAGATRGLTRFVGREAELDQLRRAAEWAGGSRGQVVAVVGEPGVGKSRLLYEFIHSHRTHDWLILESGSVSYGKATAYLPAIDLLKVYFQIDARDDVRKIREKVTGKLLTLDRALESTLPAFLALLDVPVEDQQWQALDPPQRRQRTLDAVKRLLLRESQVQPVVLVFEDLHWVDSETQALLDSLVEGLPTARLLLLVNYRPEYQHGWGSKSYYTQLRLDTLPPESAGELLRALLGEHAGLEPLRQVLITRTGGNPFFLEESVRTLAETRALVGERGAYRLAQPIHAIQVPVTVQAILAARIDRLSPEDKRLLQGASVIGKDVPFVLLQSIAEESEEDLRRGLSHLQAAEFLYETRLFPDLEYTFKHALTHEVAYASLLQERRRVLHGQILEAIERLYADRLVEQAERLAHHAVRAEAWDKALAYLRQAGTRAAARSAHREAVACFEQALGALKRLPENRDRLVQAIDLRFDLRNSLVPLGGIGQVYDYLDEAEVLAKDLDDQHRLWRVSAFKASYFWGNADYDRAIESGQRALALAVDLGDSALQVSANYYLGRVYYHLGDYSGAIDFLKRSVASLDRKLIHERLGMVSLPSVLSREWLVWSLAERGEFAEGITYGEEAVRIATAVDHPDSLVNAYSAIGGLYVLKGDFHKAIPVLERGLALTQEANILYLFPFVASPLGSAYALSGRLADGVPLLEQVVERTVSMKMLPHHSLRIANLSEVYLLASRMHDAMPLALRALDLSRTYRERGAEAYALRLLGEIASQRDPPDGEKAEEHYRGALALAEELGMRPLVALCRLGLGRLHRRIGDRLNAATHLATALALFREMEMEFWLPQAEAELREVA